MAHYNIVLLTYLLTYNSQQFCSAFYIYKALYVKAYVCLSVCLSAHNSGIGRTLSLQIFRVAPGRSGDGLRRKKVGVGVLGRGS